MYRRIGVLGGSLEYTGAPFYAAKAALLLGADLSFIFCAEEAAVSVKTYSPEIMVVPVYSSKAYVPASADQCMPPPAAEATASSRVIEYFPRLSSLVVGPGLGNHLIPLSSLYLDILYFIRKRRHGCRACKNCD